jgi:Raf kinase inhibitor-like YbhB/YbcL family protein
MNIEVTSPAFPEGGTIPRRYTHDGDDLSPPLRWSHLPDGTKSLALVCDDPDAPAGDWVHWLLYGLDAGTTSLPEGVPHEKVVDGVGVQGLNGFKRLGYIGPAPPHGKPHRYYFRLYALDTPLHLRPEAKRTDLQRAMKGHVLAEGSLMGLYER